MAKNNNRELAEDYIEVTRLWDLEVIDDGDDIARLLTIANHAINRAISAEKQLSELREVAGIVVDTALGSKEIKNLSPNASMAYHIKFCKTVDALRKNLKQVSHE
jgi:predicted hydrocarbon binding protein